MDPEAFIEKEDNYPTPDQAARFFDYRNFEMMMQRENIPQTASVLGIGQDLCQLAEDAAFFRSDIHWINVVPGHDSPETTTTTNSMPTSDNVEFISWNVTELPDIFPNEHFDRIFVYDTAVRLGATAHTIKKILLPLLKDGGALELHCKGYGSKVETFKKTPVKTKEPYMTRLPTSPKPKNNQRIEATIGPLSHKSWEYVDLINAPYTLARCAVRALLRFVRQ